MKPIDFKLKFGSVTLIIREQQLEIHKGDICQKMDQHELLDKAEEWSGSQWAERSEWIWTPEHIRIFLLYLIKTDKKEHLVKQPNKTKV